MHYEDGDDGVLDCEEEVLAEGGEGVAVPDGVYRVYGAAEELEDVG